MVVVENEWEWRVRRTASVEVEYDDGLGDGNCAMMMMGKEGLKTLQSDDTSFELNNPGRMQVK